MASCVLLLLALASARPLIVLNVTHTFENAEKVALFAAAGLENRGATRACVFVEDRVLHHSVGSGGPQTLNVQRCPGAGGRVLGARGAARSA